MSRFTLQLPPDLDALLAKDPALRSAVDAARDDFGPILHADRRPFFPEYTDHGLRHIEDVLRTAYALARDEARPLLTPQDAAVLIISVILHDLAMQIGEHAFAALVQGHLPHRSVPWFAEKQHEKPWPALWDEFRAEAARFSGRKNQDLFGSPEPVPLREPHFDLRHPEHWTRNHRLLIGEFLRRHHGRLAHEIAIHGFPSPANPPSTPTPPTGAPHSPPLVAGPHPLALTDRLPKPLRDLAGLTARSHALSLRPCLDYLHDTYQNKRTPHHCHAIFLMTLLRVADYLQIESDRAPSQTLNIIKLQSPLSIGEWKKHEAIEYIHTAGDDPEAIEVLARPGDVKTYLALQQLLSGIQSELDHSWAVLGETFGRISELHNLGLNLRRVRSNLDDSTTFAKSVSYVPEHARFRAADANLLKLLIGPLYGHEPQLGIRELIQNAVDAVRELEDFIQRHPEQEKWIRARQKAQEADVLVSIEGTIGTESNPSDHMIVISDRGIGMTADVVRGFFLVAGASLRNSEHWRKEFEDDAGHSRILRSGRFGVGALAAFLLGPTMWVQTRSIHDSAGIEFTTNLHTDPIELKRVDDAPIGTTIKIRITSATSFPLHYQPMTWDWYCLASPGLKRQLPFLERPASRIIPSADGTLPRGWYRVGSESYDDVQWTYDQLLAPLVCNGIYVGHPSEKGYSTDLMIGSTSGFIVRLPTLSVFDPDGRLPLTVDRLRLAVDWSQLDFASDLLADVIRNLVAYALVTGPSDPPNTVQHFKWVMNVEGHPALTDMTPLTRSGGNRFAPWAWTGAGIFPLRGSVASALGISSLLWIGTTRTGVPHARVMERVTDASALCIIFEPQNDHPEERLDEGASWLDAVLETTRQLFGDFSAIRAVVGNRWTNGQDVTDLMFTEHDFARRGESPVYEGGDRDQLKLDPRTVLVSIGGDDTCLAEVRLHPDFTEADFLSRLWSDHVGTVIPFDPTARRALRDKLHADPDMRPHIDYWESVAAQRQPPTAH